ncbi:MAG: penicillin-binding transpeptidase domain-containing protein [Oscillospiraceae bacterium]|nr:penicillin-binding transpeptidase domain-containing protein [Oscillospiraceae bacterium]
MEGNNLMVRLFLFGVITIAFAFVIAARLAGLQLLHDMPAYVKAKEPVYTHTVTTPAVRGDILDRNGHPLITNRQSYILTINRSYLHSGGIPAETVKSLIDFALEENLKYADTLPITGKPPFKYTKIDKTVKGQLDHYLEKMGWESDLSPQELMDALFVDYKMAALDEKTGKLTYLYDWSLEKMRRVAGVLYEVEMRYQAGLADSREGQVYYHVHPYVFAEDIPIEMSARIAENRLRGIEISAQGTREYRTRFAAHLLGRVGKIQEKDLKSYRDAGYSADETVGIDGAEKAFEPWLRGIAGGEEISTGANGRIQGKASSDAQAGKNIYLTLDIRLQAEAERILEEGIARLRKTAKALKGREAEAAAAVVLDVNTSEILAAANYPTYNLETFSEDYADLLKDPLKPLLNRSIGGVYAPGSTFKMVTASAALEKGVVSPLTAIHDKTVFSYYKSPRPRCWSSRSHGSVNTAAALRHSCNYYFYDTGLKTGIGDIVKWANNYGLGIPTGIELDEKTGIVAGPESSKVLGDTWYAGNVLSAAIGQSNNQFTPLQLANYTAAIANGGTLNKASMLKEAVSNDYSHTYYLRQPEKIHDTGISKTNVKAIQQGMREVVAIGTAASVFSGCPYDVAGKTGTVQQGNRPNNGVFVAYAPYDNPQIAVALVVEKGGGGSTIASLAREIIEAWFLMQENVEEGQQENALQR